MTRTHMKPLARLLLLPVVFGMVLPPEAAAQRSRGSVKSATRDGNTTTRQRGGASSSTTRTRSGDSATRSTTAKTRSGETVTGSKNVTKDGDTVTVNRNAQSTSGASGSSNKEYEIDDGRVESVERSAQATDRYGRSANYEGKAERDGYGVKFEGEGTNRYGQDVEVEGYGQRGRGVVAEVEGGRYGDRYVAAGRPYGGRPWATTLPAGHHPYSYYGRPYYAYGGSYYRPMGGLYVIVPPPYGAYYSTVPVGAIALMVAGAAVMYSAGTYYKQTSKGGSVSYEVVPAPAGASITSLPVGSATVTADGTTYYYCANTFYQQTGAQSFVVVAKPAGVAAIGALPADFKPAEAGGVTYFVAGGRHYLSYLNPTGQELYIAVNAPEAAAAGPVTTKQVPVTMAAGTPLKIRLATTLDSGKAKAGQIFEANMEHDLVASGQIVAPKGSRVQGQVVEARAVGAQTAPLLALQLTGISSGGRIVPISSPVVKTEGKASKAGRKVLGGAAVGATIGAIADGGSGAAIGGVVGAAAGGVATAATSKQVTLASGTTLDFTTAETATFYKSVTVQASN